MKVRACVAGALMGISISCSIQIQAAPRAMTFEEAVQKGTGLKGCPEQDVGSLEAVYPIFPSPCLHQPTTA